ncbi:unnamed protein product [Musa hybrid cultivar]
MGKRWSRGTSFLLPHPPLHLRLLRLHPPRPQVLPLPRSPAVLPACRQDLPPPRQDISGTHARDINVLRPLVPQLPKSDDGRVPPLALQVTVFPNQGAAIGVAVHHAACDGLSSTRFMSSWASTRARSKGLAGS